MLLPRSGSSRRLIVAFLAVTVLPAIVLVVMAVQLLRQDEIVRQRQLELHRGAVADQAIFRLRSLMAAPIAGVGLVQIRIQENAVAVEPVNGLAFHPSARGQIEAESAWVQEVEALEFRGDLQRAEGAYRSQANAGNGAVRVAAQMRLARVLRKLGRVDEAVHLYSSLSVSSPVPFSGVPSDLLARHAMAELTGDLQLRNSIERDLKAGKWNLDRGAYEYYAGRSLDRERESLAAAAEWLWSEWRTLPERGDRHQEDGVLVRWNRTNGMLTAVVATKPYQDRQWLEPVASWVRLQGLELVMGGGAATTLRTAAESGLPWTIGIGGGNRDSGRAGTLQVWLGLLVVSLLAGIYFVGRAIRREMEVARLQSEFVAAVSHEFRTPLTSMRHFTELLIDGGDGEPSRRMRFYHAQLRSTERLQRLVESLLDFARMEAGHHPYELKEMDLTELVEGVVRDFETETGLPIEVSRLPEPLVVHGDWHALRRGLWNLLENAAKYGGESKWIGLSVTREVDRVVIRVADRGIGIPKEEQSVVFSKFVRGAAAREAQIKGTGLGLAMLKHIIEGHGGSVGVESETGKGSTFQIVLPWRHE